MAVSVQVGPVGSAASSTLTVPVPPLEEYRPQVGDVWAVALWRPRGVQEAGPDGWTRGFTVESVVEPESGEVGDLVFWWRVLWRGEGDAPVVFVLSGASWARAVLRAYRPGREVAGEVDRWVPLLMGQWSGELLELGA